MDTSKLKPNDPRVKYETAQVRGKTYSYILAEPKGKKIDTIFLVHGFPDLAFGWRNQIPYFMSLGFQVIAPNMIGYAGTDAPQGVENYTLKSVADDVKELAEQFVGKGGQIILGGHDWGGAAVWRIALWHPQLIKAVFSVCTAVSDFNKTYTPLETLIEKGILVNFKYQLQLAGPEVEERIQGKDKLRKFFKSMLRGPDGLNGPQGFTTKHGVYFGTLDTIEDGCLLEPEELEHYVEQYSLQKAPEMRGPLNWYRTRQLNFEEEETLVKKGHKMFFEMPALYIAASRDAALPVSMSHGMERLFRDLTRGEVDATHWALEEASGEVNSTITAWLENKVLKGGIKASL